MDDTSDIYVSKTEMLVRQLCDNVSENSHALLGELKAIILGNLSLAKWERWQNLRNEPHSTLFRDIAAGNHCSPRIGLKYPI